MNIIKTLLYLFSTIFVCLFLTSCESQELQIVDDNQFEIGDSLYFSLQDINVNSDSYGNLIGPQNYIGKVVLVYFTTNET